VDKRKLYVDQLPPETTDADLIKMFGESTLNIESCRVVVDRLSGVCRGFGYIEFDSEEVAERALDYAQHNGVVARYCYVKKVWRKILYKQMRLYKLQKFRI
jgi:RNA recognition motif-containing protein